MIERVQKIDVMWNKDADKQGWKGPGWYFWDETDAYCHGPFESRREAIIAMRHYADSL